MLTTHGILILRRLGMVIAAAMVVLAMAVPAHAASLTQAWAERYVGGTDFQYASSLAVSPDGSTVYVTGISAGPEQQGDPYDVFATIAYDTSNGEVRWIDRYAFAHIDNWASTIVVTPNGQRVFVTGATPAGYPIVAYDASSGDRLWVKSVMPAGYTGFEGTLAVSPDSSRVYFSGEVQVGDGPGTKLVTRAYNTTTGAKAWGATLTPPAGTQVTPRAIAVDTAGQRLFVTGSMGTLDQVPSDNPPDFVTVGYGATTGAHLWTRTYDGANGADYAQAVAVTPNGMHVIVAGTSGAANGTPRYGVLSYAAATGTREWAVRSGSPSVGRSVGGMTLDQTGTMIYVTGSEFVAGSGESHYRTMAFSVANGARIWTKAFFGRDGGTADATAIGVSPTYLYMTGSASDGTRDTYATVAYLASTGQRVATAWYDGPDGVSARPEALGVGPGGVFVTGRGGGAYATVAYELHL
jgi:putative pyrroloquinoline-quinone binding quinoprotein